MIYRLQGCEEGDPCPQCTMGRLYETEMGLACDECEFDVVDPQKLPPREEYDGNVQAT
jgi:hypothetical protein